MIVKQSLEFYAVPQHVILLSAREFTLRAYVPLCLCGVCVFVCVYTWRSTCVSLHTYIRMCVCVRMHTYAYVCICIYICPCKYLTWCRW